MHDKTRIEATHEAQKQSCEKKLQYRGALEDDVKQWCSQELATMPKIT